MALSRDFKSAAEQKLAEYNREQKRTKIRDTAGYVLLGLVSLFLLALVGGDTFAWVLEPFGLDGFFFEGRGIYADCSKPENRNNKFCGGEGDPDTRKAEQNWNNLRKTGGMRANPFSLNEGS